MLNALPFLVHLVSAMSCIWNWWLLYWDKSCWTGVCIINIVIMSCSSSGALWGFAAIWPKVKFCVHPEPEWKMCCWTVHVLLCCRVQQVARPRGLSAFVMVSTEKAGKESQEISPFGPHPLLGRYSQALLRSWHSWQACHFVDEESELFSGLKAVKIGFFCTVITSKICWIQDSFFSIRKSLGI